MDINQPIHWRDKLKVAINKNDHSQPLCLQAAVYFTLVTGEEINHSESDLKPDTPTQIHFLP